MAAAALKHSAELNRLRDSRRFEVIHERIRVMTAMVRKCSTHFKNIRDRESHREDFEDARCKLGQACRMWDCLEGLKEAGKDIPQETIDMFVDQEKYYDAQTTRLEVGEIPESDLNLSPLVLESRFAIKEILDKVDKYGSNLDLIDSEAARIFRSPRDEFTKDLLGTVKSPARSDAPLLVQETAPVGQAAAGESVIEPTIQVPDAGTPIKVVAPFDSSSIEVTDRDTSAGRSDANREEIRSPGEAVPPRFGFGRS